MATFLRTQRLRRFPPTATMPHGRRDVQTPPGAEGARAGGEDVDCLVPGCRQIAAHGELETGPCLRREHDHPDRRLPRPAGVHRRDRGDRLSRGGAGPPFSGHAAGTTWWRIPTGRWECSPRSAAALRRVRTGRFFIMLGDMPWAAPEVYRALLRCSSADFVFPVFDGRRGHPVLCNARVKDEVLRADPASGSMKEIASRLTVAGDPLARTIRSIGTPTRWRTSTNEARRRGGKRAVSRGR